MVLVHVKSAIQNSKIQGRDSGKPPRCTQAGENLRTGSLNMKCPQNNLYDVYNFKDISLSKAKIYLNGLPWR